VKEKCALVLKKTHSFYLYKKTFFFCIVVLRKTVHVSPSASNIVCKGAEETSVVRRRLLSKSEKSFSDVHQHFIVEQKEGETG
jgi:hypothetical protein